ncbi:unnamed protein product [Lampetra fluviatilis]
MHRERCRDGAAEGGGPGGRGEGWGRRGKAPLSERESECDAEGPAPAPAPACDFAGEPEPGAPAAHSFVDHYATEAPYYGSWRRQRPTARACCGERGEAEGANHAVRQYPSAEGLAGLGPGFTMSGFSSFV